MKLMTTIALLMVLNACNGQTKNKDKMNISNHKKISKYNHFKEGEMNFNFADDINENKKKIVAEITRFGYKKPTEEVFRERIKYFFNWDISGYTNVVTLQGSLFPEIAVQDEKLIFVSGEPDGDKEIDGELLWNYNEFIFYNKSSTFNWLKSKYPFLLVELVNVYGFDKDNEVLKFVFQRTDFKSESTVKGLIFDNNDDYKSVLRESMVQKIRLLQYDNKKANNWLEPVKEDFYNTIKDLIESIELAPKDYKDSNYSIAYLMNELAISGLADDLKLIFQKHPQLIETFKNKDFYGLEKLKEYVQENK